MEKSLKNFQPMFGKVEAEWENKHIPSSHPPLLPFLFYVHASDGTHLKIHVTDFKTYTWEAVKSVQQLEDLRDYTGIGCSLSDFIDYLVESIKSDNMKLVLEAYLVSGVGAKFAKLLVHETKGMPSLTISLDRLMDSCAGDAIANASWEIFKSLKSAEMLVVQAQKLSSELTEKLHAEKEKNENIQARLSFILSSKERKVLNSIKSDKRSSVDTAAIALDMKVSETTAALAGEPLARDSSAEVSYLVPAYTTYCRRTKVKESTLADPGSGSNIKEVGYQTLVPATHFQKNH